MRLKVLRTTFTDRSTIGELYVDDAFACFTLEDMVRPVKVPGMTAIPEGVYVMTVSFSSRFRRLLPEIHNVREFTGVRLHPGNTDADTEGCILVGQTKGANFIGNSRAAFNKLFPRIQEAAQREKIFIEMTSAALPGPGPVPPVRAARGMVGVSPPPARLALVRPTPKRKKAANRAERTKAQARAKAKQKALAATKRSTVRPKAGAARPNRRRAARGVRRP
jgi:hypothetical protein